MAETDRIYIAEMAQLLERAEHTIRQWLDRSDFPEQLQPGREGGRGKIFWTRGQLPGMQRYATERAAARGSWGRPATAPS